MLTAFLLTENNESTIEQTLLQLRGYKLLVGDIGSKDNTLKIAKKYAEVVSIDFKDYSDAKNQLISKIKTDWLMNVEPGELFENKSKLDGLMKKPASFRFLISQNGIITKSVRLWHKNKNLIFKNVVFETITDNTAIESDVVLTSKNQLNTDRLLKLLAEWRASNPTLPSVHYYYSCLMLADKKYDEFLTSAKNYLFLENTGISAVMTNYYVAMVETYIKNNLQDAAKRILSCILVRPTMAEFWCLLGDIYYKNKLYEKAMTFYDNAIVLGSRRKSDMWPMETQKYMEYPNKMIESCKNIIFNKTYVMI